jgi:hypothetical protein
MATLTIDVTYTPKRPREIERFGVNFAKLLPAGDTIAAADVSITSAAGKPTAGMLQDVVNIDGAIVSQQVAAGDNGQTYLLRFAIDTMPSGSHFEIVGSLTVRD